MDTRDRKRQIDTLKIFNDCVTEVKENSEYEIEFISGDNKMCIEVSLGPDFPNEKPILRVKPMVAHAWIPPNTRDITGAPGLLNFTTHSDLGRVVQAIIRDFERTPPRVVSIAGPEEEVPASQTTPTQNNIPTGAVLPVSSSGYLFSELSVEDLSNEQIELLYKHPEHLDAFIEATPAAIEMENSLNMLMKDIEILAKENLAKETKIIEMKVRIEERTQKIYELKMRLEDKYIQHKKLTQAYTPEAIVESLRSLASKADEEAEQIAKDFLSGHIDTETFLKNYEERRSLGLRRRVKQENLANQLAQLSRAGLSSK